MGMILDEFELMLEEDELSDSSLEDTSNKNLVKAKEFIENYSKFSNSTFQGVPIQQFIKCIKARKTSFIPWEHIEFTIDLENLKNIENDRINEIVIPDFVEELNSVGDTDIGFNQSILNNIKYIDIPKSVLVIAPFTFAFYKKLETINFADKCRLISIGNRTFTGCDSLHTIDFRNCKNLYEILPNTFDGSNINTLKISSTLKYLCDLSNTNIKTIVIDNKKYSIDEFNSINKDCNNFWWTWNNEL